MRAKALRDLIIGLILAIAGLGITYYSYTSSSSGSYSVYWGLVAVGVVYAGKGLFGLIKG